MIKYFDYVRLPLGWGGGGGRVSLKTGLFHKAEASCVAAAAQHASKDCH